MKNFFDSIAKQLARFYNALPSRIRVYIYSGTSLLISGLLGLLSRDILALEVSNEYLLLFITFVTGLINVVQKEVVDAGTIKLAEQGDKKTIAKLEDKVADTKAVLNKAP